MTQKKINERRKLERLACTLEGVYISQDKYPHRIRCNNISKKGVGVVSSVSLPVNNQATFVVSSKTINPVLLEGKVCWCKEALDKWSAGVSFNKELSFNLKSLI
jgi:hypothetical protein